MRTDSFSATVQGTSRMDPERVTIRSEMPWAPFFTAFKKDDTRRIGYTRNELLDMLTVLYGGIEAVHAAGAFVPGLVLTSLYMGYILMMSIA